MGMSARILRIIKANCQQGLVHLDSNILRFARAGASGLSPFGC